MVEFPIVYPLKTNERFHYTLKAMVTNMLCGLNCIRLACFFSFCFAFSFFMLVVSMIALRKEVEHAYISMKVQKFQQNLNQTP